MSEVSPRRTFFKKIGTSIVKSLAFLGVLRGRSMALDAVESTPSPQENKGPASAASAPAVISPKDPKALKLGYVDDILLVDREDLKRIRQGVEFNKQLCRVCLFYKPTASVEDVEVGTCRFLENQLVKSNGWCSSWAKKIGS